MTSEPETRGPHTYEMYLIPELKKLMKHAYAFIYGCIRCTTCAMYYPLGDYDHVQIRVCPSFWRYNFNAYAGGGKLFLLKLIHENELKWSKDVADVVYRCTTCGNCRDVCNTLAWRTEKYNTMKIFELMRAELAARGFMPKEQQVFVDRINNFYNPYGEPHDHRTGWVPANLRLTNSSDTAYFTGCTAAYRRPEIAQATARVLNLLNVPFRTLHPEEWCCGSPALRVGDRETFARIAQHNAEAIRKSGIKRIVTSCAGCYRSLRHDYPQFVGELPVEIVHMSELLADILNKKDVKFRKPIKEAVTYHDPCHLGRHCGVFEQPREVINAVPGIKYVELPRNRKAAWCCGAGGGVKSAFPDFALWAARDRLEEVRAVGAETLVSTCPFCSHNFKDAINEGGYKTKYYDLTEFVAKSL